MSEGVALRALAAAAKTEEVRDQLLRIAEMYDQLANYLRGPDAQASEVETSEAHTSKPLASEVQSSGCRAPDVLLTPDLLPTRDARSS